MSKKIGSPISELIKTRNSFKTGNQRINTFSSGNQFNKVNFFLDTLPGSTQQQVYIMADLTVIIVRGIYRTAYGSAVLR